MLITHFYHITLSKIVAGGPKNFDSYYVCLKDNREEAMKISKAIRSDE